MGKGLSKDEKARKLALQHWLEAVRMFFHNGFSLCGYEFCVMPKCDNNRSILDIAMATICNSITMLGFIVTVTNPFSIGRFAIYQQYQKYIHFTI